MINAVGEPQSLLLLGGTSDIALAIARRYARSGLRVVLAARPSERRTAAASELTGLGCEITEVDLDARDHGSHAATVELAFAGKPANPNAVLFEFFYLLTATAYAVAILSYAYKALKGFDVDNSIDKQSAREENDPSLHMPMGAH